MNLDNNYVEQEAQLLLRNRASAMHFFVAKLLSIAVITYIRLSPVKPTPEDLANLLRTHRINFSVRPQHMYDARPHCRLISNF